MASRTIGQIVNSIVSNFTSTAAAAAPPVSANDMSVPHSLLNTLAQTVVVGLASEDTPIPSCAGQGLVGWQQTAGIVFAFICFSIYAPSRIPQIISNYKRKSTYGISGQFIAITFVTLFFYTGSILIPSARYDATNGYRSRAFWLQTFPYLASIIVGGCLNAVIAAQIYLYRDRTRADAVGEDISDQQANDDEEYDLKVNQGNLMMGTSTSAQQLFLRSDSTTT